LKVKEEAGSLIRMVVRLLGSAAGGGGCAFQMVWAGMFQRKEFLNGTVGVVSVVLHVMGGSKSEHSVAIAVSVDHRRWILINASPDLRSQLLCFPVQPSAGRRETPVEAVLPSDADLDHILGLFLLRESDSEVSIHTSQAIRRAVEEGLRLTEILSQYCGVRWVEVLFEFSPLFCRDGSDSGFEYKGIESRSN
jgi:pyrroloquinoline quinone biosynthesis protein B